MLTSQQRQRWHSYYTRKRMRHQHYQLYLLDRFIFQKNININKILEIGPAFGAVTAMLKGADYDVTTLDIVPQMFTFPQNISHIQADLRHVHPEDIKGFDAIICCETLEHIDYSDVPSVLKKFRASGARYLITSVPYMGFQLAFDFYINSYAIKQFFCLKKFNTNTESKQVTNQGQKSPENSQNNDPKNALNKIEISNFKKFKKEPEGEHQWEVGYKETPLKLWEKTLADAGWSIVVRDFTVHTRSVFHILEAK
ncbi:MAG: class I SAM-dependent methyltransferase [Holosporales bacterium]|jgi:cyclopropane fatty-acyl-phospholipid synthase-like methyltransferase